jgi:guanylate kinase
MTAEASFSGFPPPPPLVVVLSGPSGAGKTVICRKLLESDPSLALSISATTRPPRGREQEGVEYYFWDEARFRQAIADGFFLEWAEVHGSLYGTPRAALEEHVEAGRSPLLDVDVQGGRSVKHLLPDAVLILVAPPSLESLAARLRGRKTDSEAAVQRRLAAACRELEEWTHYDYVVVNEGLDQALADVRSILTAERARVARRVAPAPPS